MYGVHSVCGVLVDYNTEIEPSTLFVYKGKTKERHLLQFLKFQTLSVFNWTSP